MLPFCGYNMGDYWQHWLSMGKRLSNPPKIFRVNWFNRGSRGEFLWPGFGENLRVLRWIIERSRGDGKADETPIGYVPTLSSIDRQGLDLADETMSDLLRVDREGWRTNLRSQSEFFEKFGDHLPRGIRDQHSALRQRLRAN